MQIVLIQREAEVFALVCALVEQLDHLVRLLSTQTPLVQQFLDVLLFEVQHFCRGSLGLVELDNRAVPGTQFFDEFVQLPVVGVQLVLQLFHLNAVQSEDLFIFENERNVLLQVVGRLVVVTHFYHVLLPKNGVEPGVPLDRVDKFDEVGVPRDELVVVEQGQSELGVLEGRVAHLVSLPPAESWRSRSNSWTRPGGCRFGFLS